MKHHVFWHPEADEKLRQFVAQAENPEELAAAIRRIDRMLSRYPLGFGESRYENVRVAFESPFGLQYEVLDNPPP